MVRSRRNKMHRVTNAFRIENVERNKCCHRAGFPERLGCILSVLGIARAEKNVKSLAAELPGHFEPDSLVSPSYQGGVHARKLP